MMVEIPMKVTSFKWQSYWRTNRTGRMGKNATTRANFIEFPGILEPPTLQIRPGENAQWENIQNFQQVNNRLSS